MTVTRRQDLHSIGIFHSDLKMENILLDMSSDSKTVLEAVISDFGFSIDFNSLGVHFYKNGDFKCRAPEFMKIPPGTEIDRNFAFSGDVYSMGLIIRSLICEWLPSFHPISKLTERMSHPDPTQRITAREAAREFKTHFVKFIPDIQPSVDLSSSMRSSSLEIGCNSLTGCDRRCCINHH
jgi:serine/threonine protein kinase